METTFIENDCTITHEGKDYTSGGAWLADCTDHIRRGVVYVNTKKAIVTTWHGEKIAACTWTDYRGNFCRMRRVSFTLDGIKFIGDYCPDWSECVKVRSTKKITD